MCTAKNRVFAEIMDLTANRDLLDAFMRTKAFDQLTEDARGLIYAQIRIMEGYEMILRMRHRYM